MPTTFNTYGRQWILNLGQWTTGAHHWIWNSNSMIQFGRWGGEQIQNVNILQCDSLTMVVEPSTEMKLFCNGQLVGRYAGSVPFDIQNGNLAVASSFEQGFTGCVKQVRIWNRALTDDVVQQLNSSIFDVSSTVGQCMSGNYDIGTVLRQQAHTIHVELSMPTTFNTYGRQWILNLGQWTTGAHHWIWNSNSMIQFGRWGGEQIQNVNILQCDSLTMVVEPSTEMKLFCNGQLVGRHAGSVPFNIQNGNLAVASKFTGCVKQVRIWNRALTDDVVQKLN